MTAENDYRPVLAAYPVECQPTRIEFLGSAGGFSGAQFWRLETPRGPLCLRRWPQEYPPTDQLEFIQAVLWHVDQEGFRLVPVPLETMRHAGYVRSAGHLWELSPWLPGTADYLTSPSATKLSAAMQALARFHVAAASFPLPDVRGLASPGIRERCERLRAATPTRLAQLSDGLRNFAWPELSAAGQRLLDLFPLMANRVDAALAQAAGVRVDLQPCIRDPRHDHILYLKESVSGLIDFGALRPESVSGDVARLLGSLVDDSPEGWQQGLAAYQSLRPLSADELLLVQAFDQGNVLLAGINWLSWLVEEGRTFDDRPGVIARLQHYGRRLAHLAGKVL
jgi:Ser/Thr protein kinase RdoA (MazF antagonist)